MCDYGKVFYARAKMRRLAQGPLIFCGMWRTLRKIKKLEFSKRKNICSPDLYNFII